MNAAQYPELGYTKCENNFVEAIKGDRNNTFRCQNMGMQNLISLYRSACSNL